MRTILLLAALLASALTLSTPTTAIAQERAACLASANPAPPDDCAPRLAYAVGFEIAFTLPEAVASAWFQQSYSGYFYCRTVGLHTAKVTHPAYGPGACDRDSDNFDHDFSPNVVTVTCAASATTMRTTAATAVPSTGHYQVEIDYRSAIPFIRYYNSKLPSKVGPLGPKWKHHYERDLEISSTDILANRHNGQVIKFTKQLNGTYTAPTGVTAKLERRIVQSPGLPVVVTWVFTGSDGVQEIYTAAGELQTITNGADVFLTMERAIDRTVVAVHDKWKNKLSFMYSGTGSAKRLSSVKNPRGVTIMQFNYTTARVLSSVTFLPSTLSRVYKYDETGRKGGATTPALTGIIDQVTGVPSTGVRVGSMTYDAKGGSIPQSTATAAIATAATAGANEYLEQTDQITLAYLWVLRRPITTTTPPTSGTMRGNQPPPGHAIPIPPGPARPTYRPERPERPGTAFPMDTPETIPSSPERVQKCTTAAKNCLRQYAPGMEDILSMQGTGGSSGGGACPAPTLTPQAMRCLRLYTLCVNRGDLTIDFPDGTRVQPD